MSLDKIAICKRLLDPFCAPVNYLRLLIVYADHVDHVPDTSSNITDSLSEDVMAMTVGFVEIGCIVFTPEVIPFVYTMTLA